VLFLDRTRPGTIRGERDAVNAGSL